MSEHIRENRLAKVAGEGSRLTETELAHLTRCNECLAAYAKSILRVARLNAKKKCTAPERNNVRSG
jgi:hypothetical protein